MTTTSGPRAADQPGPDSNSAADAAPDQVTAPPTDAPPTDAGARATVVSERASLPVHDLPVLEAYRGLAAVMVVFTHVGTLAGAGLSGPWAGWLARLDFGVALFFLLSGFLLFRPFVQAAYGRRPPVGVRSYLRRRVVRIYPAFVVALVADYLLTPAARHASGSLWFDTLFMLQNYTVNFIYQLPGMIQSWTLAVEVSFYVGLPLLAWLLLGRGTRATSRGIRPGLLIGLMMVIAVGWRIYYTRHDSGVDDQQLWLPGFLDWFGAGMLLAWLRERPEGAPTWLRGAAAVPGACWSLALALYWLATTSLAGSYGLQGSGIGEQLFKHLSYLVIATLLLVPAVFGEPSARWRRTACNPFFSWLGRISFGVYLWHPMLLTVVRSVLGRAPFDGGFWITLILTLTAAALAGTLSWTYVEEPLQRLCRNGFPFTVSRPH